MTLRKISLLVLGLLMIFSLAATSVVAQGDDEPDEMPQTIDNDSASDRKRLQQELSDRLADYKQNRSDAFNKARENIITRKCAAAQIKVTLFKEKVEAAKVRRTTVYTNILDKMSDIITRLGNAGVDTESLVALVTSANESSAQISADIDSFIQVLSDITEMDCTDDPEGFQAALEAARNLASDIKADVNAFHLFMKQDVKTAFRDAVSGLGNSDTNNSEGEN